LLVCNLSSGCLAAVNGDNASEAVDIFLSLSLSLLAPTNPSATLSNALLKETFFTIAVASTTPAIRQASYVYSRAVSTVLIAISSIPGSETSFLYNDFICCSLTLCFSGELEACASSFSLRCCALDVSPKNNLVSCRTSFSKSTVRWSDL